MLYLDMAAVLTIPIRTAVRRLAASRHHGFILLSAPLSACVAVIEDDPTSSRWGYFPAGVTCWNGSSVQSARQSLVEVHAPLRKFYQQLLMML